MGDRVLLLAAPYGIAANHHTGGGRALGRVFIEFPNPYTENRVGKTLRRSPPFDVPRPIAKGDYVDHIEIVVHRASIDFADWEVVRTLIQEAFAYMEGRIDPPSSALRLTPQSMAVDAADGGLLLAWSESTLVGCAFVRHKEAALYIGKLAVRPALHGKGIGKALVEAARAEARVLGLKRLELQTRIELIENHAAFARMGFVQTATTAHPGFKRPTSITMQAPV